MGCSHLMAYVLPESSTASYILPDPPSPMAYPAVYVVNVVLKIMGFLSLFLLPTKSYCSFIVFANSKTKFTPFGKPRQS